MKEMSEAEKIFFENIQKLLAEGRDEEAAKLLGEALNKKRNRGSLAHRIEIINLLQVIADRRSAKKRLNEKETQ